LSKWSIALWGYDKRNYILVDKKTGIGDQGHLELPDHYDPDKHRLIDMTTENERRIKPGDVVAWKYWKDRDKWTTYDRQICLIIILNSNLVGTQLGALKEPQYDLTTWAPLNGRELTDDEDLDGMPDYPMKNIFKRRFHIPLQDLESLGVDITKMKDKDLVYQPDIEISTSDYFFDKMNSRKLLPTDGLNPFKPRKLKGVPIDFNSKASVDNIIIRK